MPASAARIEELTADLAHVRQAIRDAWDAHTTAVDGRSLTRQALGELRREEARLTWALREARTGSPYGRRAVLARRAYPLQEIADATDPE